MTIQGCALETPLKAHPFVLVPSWKLNKNFGNKIFGNKNLGVGLFG